MYVARLSLAQTLISATERRAQTNVSTWAHCSTTRDASQGVGSVEKCVQAINCVEVGDRESH